jgi:carbamoyl-phosphate synthase large subunit
MHQKTVLVTGIGGNVGQGILRVISSLGWNIKLIGIDINTFNSGIHLCHKTYTVPYAMHNDYIPKIKEIIEIEKIDLIIPSTDYEVFYLSKNEKVLETKIVVSNHEISKIFLDKYLTYKYMVNNDIQFAKSWLPSEYDFSLKNIIAKPREGRGSRGILLNPENITTLSESYIIQPYLEGIEITSAVYINKEKEVHGVFSMERELTNGTTTKSKVTFTYDNQIRSIAEKLNQTGGIVGSFNIQSIVLDTSEVIPFEINCRLSGTSSIRHNLGFQDVKYTLQEYLLDNKPDLPEPKLGVSTRILMDVIYSGSQEYHQVSLDNAQLF